jgi:hypothetical protein
MPPTEDESRCVDKPGSKNSTTAAKTNKEAPPRYEDDFDALTRRFEALKKR